MELLGNNREISRRNLVKVGAGAAGGLLLGRVGNAEAARSRALASTFRNEGAGLYTDPSVANQASSFSINPIMVSCGVGTVAQGDNWGGPFTMVMYATKVRTYKIDKAAGTLTVRGRMRSITAVSGEVVEDAMHSFLAIAVDGRDEATDRFDVHFATPFWADNPMCTPSEEVDGWCRFGGELMLGDISVVKP